MMPGENNQQTANPKQMVLQAQQLLARNRVQDAARLADQVVTTYPDYASGWACMALVLLTANNASAALEPIERALARNPDNASWQILAARTYLGVSRLEDAETALAKGLDRNESEDPGLYCDAGFVYTVLQKHEQAGAAFRAALASDPNHATAHFNLGMNQRFLGNLEAAETSLDRAIQLDPSQFEAILARSDLRQQTEDRHHVDTLQRILTRQLPPLGEIQVSYALGKELEDLGRYSESFANIKRGADLRTRMIKYDVQGDVRTIRQIMAEHTRPALAATVRGCDDPSPIFILGLPRTGTTLTERLISSHSEVRSAEELQTFGMEMVRLCKGQQAKQDMVSLALQIDMKELGESYLSVARQVVPDTPRFIDKLPLNYLYCGLISRALPNARIIHLKRDPMDACYAIYKALFKQAYPFSYNLDALATYYIAYRQLVTHWEKTLGNHICHVHYENIVADTEREARRLIAYCGLAWEDQVLEFHKKKEASTTASAAQVRRGVYTSSVGRWRHYEKQLAPLRNRLDDAGVLRWPDVD